MKRMRERRKDIGTGERTTGSETTPENPASHI